MQFTTLSVAFFAALATASQHVPQHFHHRRQLNATGPSTTLTVFATSVYTITSCAASITNCPARASESTNVVVTDVIMLTTTVCPVAQASSAASQILASFSASASVASIANVKGNVVSSTAPAITSVAAPLSTGVMGSGSGAAFPSGSDSVVLTYTLGSGTSTTVVTTTIKHVNTKTVYATIPAASPAGQSMAAGVVTSVAGAVNAISTGPTTTIYGTSTSTKYVTVIPATTLPAAAGVQGAVVPSANGACVPVTVTVALSTVTVTETAVPTTAAPAVAVVSSAVIEKANAVVTSAEVVAITSGDVIVIKSTATVIPVMSTGAPYGNATLSTKTKKKCSSIFPSGTAPVAVSTGM